MKHSNRYSPELRERAVRLVLDPQGGHESQWAAIVSVSPKVGCSAETLRKWVRQAERDTGVRPGLTSDERERLKALERENLELRRANEILRKASAYFAQAELDRRPKSRRRSSTRTAASTGSSRSAGSCRSPRRRTTRARPGKRTAGGWQRVPIATRNCASTSGVCRRRTTGCTGFARWGASSNAKASRWRAARSRD